MHAPFSKIQWQLCGCVCVCLWEHRNRKKEMKTYIAFCNGHCNCSLSAYFWCIFRVWLECQMPSYPQDNETLSSITAVEIFTIFKERGLLDTEHHSGIIDIMLLFFSNKWRFDDVKCTLDILTVINTNILLPQSSSNKIDTNVNLNIQTCAIYNFSCYLTQTNQPTTTTTKLQSKI